MLILILFKSLFFMPLLGIPHNIVIDSKLIYNGKQISSPRITTIKGRKAVITETDRFGKAKFSLELKPLNSVGQITRMEYSLLIKEAKGDFHSHGILNLNGDQQGLISLDKGRVQIKLKVNRS